jgi:energy-coupling factor transport system permease protein
MNIFLYLDRDTPIHRLDPRAKIGAAAAVFGVCLCFNHPVWVGWVGLGVLAAAGVARAMPNLWRFRYPLLLLLTFSSLIWPFFVRGETRWGSWGFLEVSRESVLYGLAVGLRLASFVATGLVFFSTTRNEEFTNGLIRMKTPYPLAFALSTALRLVPTFVGAGATIIQAQMSRGLDLEGGSILRRLGKFVPQAVPLFIYAIHQTNHLAMALESRGFDPCAPRTLYYEPRMGRGDWAVLAICVLALTFCAVLRLGLGLGAVIPGRI